MNPDSVERPSLHVHEDGPAIVPPAGSPLEAFLAQHRATQRGIAGGVYVLPPEARGDGDQKVARRHLLAVRPSDLRAGTAIYGTKSLEAARRDAPHRSMRPRLGRDGNGLDAETRFYPTVVTYVFPRELDEMRGRLTNAEWDPILRETRRAFGIGEGRRGDPGVPPVSWRGRIVEFPREVVRTHGVQFGVVLTCHEHSRHRYDQIVIPMAESDPAIDDPQQDVVSDDSACAALLGIAGAFVWVVPMMFTIHQKRQPLVDTGHTITEGDLARIEATLAQRFGF